MTKTWSQALSVVRSLWTLEPTSDLLQPSVRSIWEVLPFGAKSDVHELEWPTACVHCMGECKPVCWSALRQTLEIELTALVASGYSKGERAKPMLLSHIIES